MRERGGGERGTGSVMSRVWPDMARPGRQDTRPGPAGAHLNMVKHVCLLSGSTEVLGSLQLKRERERERQRPRLEVPPRPVRPAPDPPPLNEQGRLASALLANAARATSQSAFQNFFFSVSNRSLISTRLRSQGGIFAGFFLDPQPSRRSPRGKRKERARGCTWQGHGRQPLLTLRKTVGTLCSGGGRPDDLRGCRRGRVVPRRGTPTPRNEGCPPRCVSHRLVKLVPRGGRWGGGVPRAGPS